jgi:anion-transporting  ArsA/GET3 family ATPase
VTFQALIERHRLIVCIGPGGVGKTTVSAAIALAAALRGRRAMVLTIDPARQLARALGLEALRQGGERVPREALRVAGLPDGLALDAGMLDQKAAWDDFIARHAPSPDLRARILENPFYQRLSSSFSGSTEYMAVEEMCRLDQSGRYDLIVLDTPPASHALDFFEAPKRIEALLDRELSSWLTRPYEAVGRGAWWALGATARTLLRRLERATSARTLRDISAFFVAIDGLLDDVIRRTQEARRLLRASDTAVVLVAAPERLVLDETTEMARRMRELGTPLRGLVLNRFAPELAEEASDVGAVLDALADTGVDAEIIAWMRETWTAAVTESDAAVAERGELFATLPPELCRAVIGESSHDAHSLADLVTIAEQLMDGG